MKLGELKGKQVVAVGQATKVGVVLDVILDASCREIESLVIGGDKSSPDRAVSGQNVTAIGRDVVTIDSTGSLRLFDPATPEANLPRASSILGSHIVTQGGQIIGQISDIDFYPNTRQIVGFEFDGGPIGSIFGRHHLLDPRNIIRVGPGLVTVSDEAKPAQAA